MSIDLKKTYLSPNETNPIKQDSIIRQILECAQGFDVFSRSDIPNRVLGNGAIQLSGFSSPGDAGIGAIYVAGTSTGTMAIKDAAGNWFNLAFSGRANVGWFGAKGDGATGDTSAIQTAINAVQAVNGTLVFPFASGCRTTGTLNITDGMTIMSDGGSDFVGGILPDTGISPGIQIQTHNPVNIHDFKVYYANQETTAVSGITVTSTSGDQNTDSYFRNVWSTHAGVCFDLVKANGVKLVNCQVGASIIGVQVANQNNPDLGDCNIDGCTIIVSSGGTGVLHKSGGGLRVVNNKINAGGGASFGYHMNYGLDGDVVITDGSFIENNSIEGFVTGIQLERSTTATSASHQIIANNEFNALTGVSIPTDAHGTWLNGLIISGNAIANLTSSTAHYGVNIDSVNGVIVQSNAFMAVATAGQPVVTGTNATNGAVGPNAVTGTFTSTSTIGSTTVTGYTPT